MRFSLLLLSILACFTLCSCFLTQSDTKYVKGQITDADGQPVTNAYVGIDYVYENTDAQERPTTSIHYSLHDAGYTKIWISTENISDTVKVLLNENMDVGYHYVTWDATNDDGYYVKTGFYKFNMRSDESSDTLVIAVPAIYCNVNNENFTQFTYYDKTDENGKFSIPDSQIMLNSSMRDDMEHGNLTGKFNIYAFSELHGQVISEEVNYTSTESMTIDIQYGEED